MAVAIALLAAAMPAIERQLNTWGVLPRQQQLTELYFTHPSGMPKKYSATAELPVSFTIHNHTTKLAPYRYTISENGVANSQAKNPSQQLSSETVTVAAGESRTVTVQVRPADLGTRIYLVVSLPNSGEQIGYWLQRGTE